LWLNPPAVGSSDANPGVACRLPPDNGISSCMEGNPSCRMGNVCCFEFLASQRSRQGMKHVAQDCKRTTNSVFRVRCMERPEIGQSLDYPVKLVIFDFDETLTLVTLMTPDGTYTKEQEEWARLVNFESPWVEGSRVEKLQRMFEDLVQGKDGETRVLACLTRNGNSSGVSAVINLLQTANLDKHLSAVWALPHRPGRRCGAYQEDGRWIFFDPPVRRAAHDHKADVLRKLVECPKAWFPQIGGSSNTSAHVGRLDGLLLEEVVLVDDQRANFQSETGAQVLRYCKVARYDAEYRDFGVMRDMGGIGAHDDADFDALKRFVEDPWMCKDTYQVRCQERDFEGCEKRHPVKLVVFDFDETLTMATFMPKDPEFAKSFSWSPSDNEWSVADLVEYNFESPYAAGSRVAKLKKLLSTLAKIEDGKPYRTLAVLTRNDHGVIAVLNLLKIAGLAEFFSAIWAIPARTTVPSGLYREESGEWHGFDPPVSQVNEHKADVLHHVASNVAQWFPQLASGSSQQCVGLQRLSLEGIVLVDDERANFRSNSEAQAKVLRYCKVARYDEVYRDCGVLNQMGGLGAHSDQDYETLKSFVERPWEYPYETQPRAENQDGSRAFRHGVLDVSPSSVGAAASISRKPSSPDLCRDTTAEETEPPKAPRVRKSSVQADR